MDQIKIGRFIAFLRKEQNMTQQSLADKLGITDRAVSKWENGRGLPDVSLMKSLCEILGISIDELLNGERADKIESKAVNESNLLNVLLEREKEIQKRKYLSKLCTLLVAVTILFLSVFGFKLSFMAAAGVRGEGYSLYTAIYTRKAEKTAKFIVSENYEKAAEYIGFEGWDGATAKNNWIKNMKALSDKITIEAFEISKIIYDDYFPAGSYFMVVYDKQSGAKYVFDGLVTIQDKGVSFGGVYLSQGSTDYRREEVADLINKTLCTWYAG